MRRFVLFQAVVWALLSTVVALPAVMFPGVSWPGAAAWVVAWATLGMLGSTGIAVFFERLPDRWLRGLPAIGTITAACTVASALWTLGMVAVQPVTGREPWSPPMAPPAHLFVMTFVRGAFFYGLWSALFLVNLLSQRVQRAREDSIRAEALTHEVQLQLLRGQINPHFLFNALNSVVALISENPRAAQGMVRDVAALLRKALDVDGRSDTTVEQELAFVRLYVKCEQVRFEDRLRVEYDVADDVLPLPVPPMLLHPLVENAIKHGMHGAVDRPLIVRISLRRAAPELLFTVENTGTLGAPRDPLLPSAPGIGLRNIRGRLEHIFPGRHSFTLAEDDGWVRARITVPLRVPEPTR